MQAGDLRRLWAAAGDDGDRPPRGDGLFGLRPTAEAVALTGAALAVLGLPLNGPGDWPAAVRRASQAYVDWLPRAESGFRVADYGDVVVRDEDPAGSFADAHERLVDIVAAGATPLVLGGDTLVTEPVLQVLSGKLLGRLGVVAFTPAYEVALEPQHAAQSRWARALELGVLAPGNLALVGGRNAPQDAPARSVLDRLGATRFSLEDVVREGMPTLAQEALEVATAGTEAVYLSVDVAVLAGVGDPVGLEARELADGVRVVSSALLTGVDVCSPAGAPTTAAAAGARVAAEIVAGVAGLLS